MRELINRFLESFSRSREKPTDEDWKRWAREITGDRCVALGSGEMPSRKAAGFFVAHVDPLIPRWEWTWPAVSGDSYAMVVIPVLSGLSMTVLFAAGPWVIFHLARWIAAGFHE
jgi:hypothetical protein